jgi:hypothetical protein
MNYVAQNGLLRKGRFCWQFVCDIVYKKFEAATGFHFVARHEI